MDADVIVVGGGLAGLVATAELADAGKKVLLVDQEPENYLGGQAFWSLGGLMFVDSPEQRRMRVKDSYELALQDWLGTAAFDRPEDEWPRKWAEAYVGFCAGEKRSWLHGQGMRWIPNPGWPERGGYHADGHGNSVPRFHITWGTGPGVVAPFERRVREAVARGLVELRFRHRVDELVVYGGAVTGVRGRRWRPALPTAARRPTATRPASSSCRPQAVVVTTGGIGGNHDLVRENWPERLGEPPRRMLSGVPAHVDGRMLAIARDAGANEINADRMWHYVEGIHNWDPIWPRHAIRIIPGPSALWFDATGKRLPGPLYPGYDTLGTLAHIQQHRPRLHVVRAHREDHREGVRALGLRAEPRHHLEERQGRARGPGGQRPARAGAGVQGPRRGLHRRAQPARPGAADERAHRRRPDRPAPTSRPRSWPATARSTTPTPRTARSPPSTAPAPTGPTASPASPRRTRSSTPRPGR